MRGQSTLDEEKVVTYLDVVCWACLECPITTALAPTTLHRSQEDSVVLIDILIVWIRIVIVVILGSRCVS